MFRVRMLDEVESTNIEIKRAIDEGEPEGLVVRARRQTGGYGRQGRIWRSPEGGLYFSMLLRPDVALRELPTLALVAGLAVRRALVRFARSELVGNVRVKWPNDIVFSSDAANSSGDILPSFGSSQRFFKLCGISSEVHGSAVCIGIGVNICASSAQGGGGFGAKGKNAPAYMGQIIDGSRLGDGDLASEVFAAILEEFELLYRRWAHEGFRLIASEYAACESLRGSRVDVVDLSGKVIVSGVVEGVAAEGCLLVRDEENDGIVSVASGEAHIA